MLAGLGCSGKSTAPAALPPAGTLAPGLTEPASRELSVVYAGPRGAAERSSTINILFDRPLRALDAAAAPPPLVLEPAVPGEWSWTGSRGVTFVPRAGRLPLATAFRVTVPKGVAALDGTRLGAAFEFGFETPAPHVLATSPEAGATGEEPGSPISITFDQPVSARALEQSAKLHASRNGRRESLAFSVKPRPSQPERVDIVPRRPLPLGSSIELTVAAGLRGNEGPRPLEQAWSFRFDTYGPLQVVAVRCNVVPDVGRCDPEGAVWVELSNPVKAEQFVGHLGIEPPVALRWPDELDDENRYFYLPLSGGLAPSTAYRVNIAAGLTDKYGQTLAEPRRETLQTGHYSPRVELPVSGEVFVAPLGELGLVSRNALDLTVFSRRLDDKGLLDLYASQADYKQSQALMERFAQGGVPVPGAIDDQIHTTPIALGPALGGGARGAAWVGWRSAKSSPMGQVVQVTDLALTAKLSDQGSLVWVTRLSNGQPVAGATVELTGRAPQLSRRYQSDANGLVSIPRQDYAPRFNSYGTEEDTLLFARHDGDSSFRRVADILPPWRLDVPTRLDVSEKEYALLFAERGIYRPGDTVRIKGILRREASSGNTLPAARKLALELRDPFEEVSERQEVQTTRFATFSADVKIPGSAALGQWHIAAEGLPDDALSIQVAEYRPAEFEVAVEPVQPAYLEGESAGFAVRADYLFGSPLANMPVSFGVTRERADFAPPNTEGYVTSDAALRRDLPYAALDSSRLAQSDAQLSAAGRYQARLPLVLPGQTGAERVRVDASVTDVSRQVIASSAAVLVHPASHYVALAQLDSWFRNVPSTLEPGVLAVSPSGERLAGRAVRLELVRRRWTLAREKTADGWQTISRPVDEVQGSCDVVSAREPVHCPLDLRESGQFFVHATSADERGRTAGAALELYAIGAGRASWADNDQRKLELVLDKSSYRVGETAKLLIKNPFVRAEALFTVERAGLYEHRRLTLEGPTPTLEIPIDERLRPNAFVSVHLVQGVAPSVPGAGGASPEPGYRLGYAELRVDPEARRLGVQLKSDAVEYRPGQRARLELSVSRPGGAPQPAELTVYAVDEGVLSLTGYQPPDPVAIFTAPRPLAVATLESRDALGRLLLPGLERDKGAPGGGGGALGIRSNFRTTAYFDPAVLADATGKATVEFELPDNLTTFRVMAVAISDDDRYGVGSTRITVNKPLMLRPALPRLLRAGDRVEAAVVVNGRGIDPGEVTVGLALSGATLEGPASRQVRVERGASSEVRFTVLAERPGDARFEFSATAGALTDRVSTSRRVETPVSLEATALYGRTNQAEAQALGDLSALRKDTGGLTLSLASTALVGLDAGLSQLTEYPYACTEQLASGLLPLAPLRGLAERYGLELPKDVGAAVEARVGQILTRQRGDGGFGLWPDSPEPHAWASAYALWVLDLAKQSGARVPARVFESGVAYLRQWLSEPRPRPEQQATAALMVDVLAALGQPDPEYLGQLYAVRQKLPVFSRALLLHAAAVGKSDAAVIGTLATELEATVSLHGNQAQVTESRELLSEVFDSEARTEALILWALLARDPKHPLGEPLARGVLARRDAGHWKSTQESAYALLALDAYRRARESEAPHFEAAVWFGRERLLEASFESPDAMPKGRSLGMSELAALSGNLLFEKQGTGSLYYEARLTYAPLQLPDAPLERGFSLQKSVRRVELASLSAALEAPFDPAAPPSTISGGDLVLVDVVVGAPAVRHYVVVEDPLPAGLEAVDSSLATSSPALDVSTGTPEEASGFAASWFRRELRDGKVAFFVDEMPPGLYRYRYLARATALGRFVTPPTRVYEMYQPEVFARSGAGTLELR